VNVQLVILIVYALILAAISAAASKMRQQAKGEALEYLLAGRRLPAVVVAAMLAGLAIGGVSTVGVAQDAYVRGLSAGWYNAAWGISGIVVGVFAASFLRRSGVTTIPEMMGRLYGKKARFVGAIAQLLVLMVITSLQYVAGGAILTAILPTVFTFQTGMIATALLFVGIAFIGGYWAGGISNIVNVIVIYVGIVAALIASAGRFGGWEAITANLPAGGPWFDWVSGAGIAMIAAWMAVMLTQCFSVQAISQIAFAAKDEKTARLGFILGGIIIMPAGFLCALFGVIAAAQFPGLEKAAMALPTLATQINPFVGGLFLAGLWAADISTAVALLLGSATLVLEDIVKAVLPAKALEGREILYSRGVILIVSLGTFFLALTAANILRTVTTALAITASFTLLILARLFVPAFCRRANGFWTILTSLVVWVLWTFLPAFRITPHIIYLQWPLCLAAFLVTSILDKEPLPAEELASGALPSRKSTA
jgi:SSS family solute:Na+ symporter